MKTCQHKIKNAFTKDTYCQDQALVCVGYGESHFDGYFCKEHVGSHLCSGVHIIVHDEGFEDDD